jgi:flagellar motility protein MotE (MotC chaperone)
MKKRLLFRAAVITVAAATAAGMNFAQDAAKPAGQKSSSAAQQKTTSKPRKVWTDDDLGSLRREGSITVAAAQTPTIPVSPDAAPAPAPKQTQAGKPSVPGKAAALSNPKTTEEADGMIAWEQRDIDSQQQDVDRVQQQVDQASPDQKERLQKVLAERQQVLADTRREQQDLIAQKKLLQKKSSADTSVAASQP